MAPAVEIEFYDGSFQGAMRDVQISTQLVGALWPSVSLRVHIANTGAYIATHQPHSVISVTPHLPFR